MSNFSSAVVVMLSASYILVTALVPAGCGGLPDDVREPSPETLTALERAEGFERKRQYEQARAAYLEAVETAPDQPSGAHAAHRFASALAFWGEVPGAIEMLETAVTLDAKRASAWHDLGILRARAGQLATGETALRRARKLVPRDARPRIALAALLVKTKRYSEARDEYRALLELELPDKTRRAIKRALALLAAEPGAAPK